MIITLQNIWLFVSRNLVHIVKLNRPKKYLHKVFEKTFVKEYLRNPFLLWSLIILVLSIFDSVFFAIKTLQTIVVWYVPIVFGSLTFVFICSFYPIQRGLVEFGRNENKIIAIGFVILICLLFYTEIIYFMIEPFAIFAALFPESISDKNTFQIDIYASDLIHFLALPLLSAFIFTCIKNTLKKKYTTNDKITNNLKFVAYIVIVNSAMYFLFIFLTSTIWIDFSTWFSKNLGDVPSWIMAIATPLSIFIGFLIANKQLKQSAKIEEQKFLNEVDKMVKAPENHPILRSIYNELYESKTFEIKGEEVERSLSNYLSDLEYVCILHKQKIVSKSQLKRVIGINITEAIKCKSVKNFIDKEREKTKMKASWQYLEEMANELESKPEK